VVFYKFCCHQLFHLGLLNVTLYLTTKSYILLPSLISYYQVLYLTTKSYIWLPSLISDYPLKCYWTNETCRKSKLTIVVPFRNPYVHLIQYRNNWIIIKMPDIKIVHKIVFGCVRNWLCITLQPLYLASYRLSCT
jgi:hypothetical protein